MKTVFLGKEGAEDDGCFEIYIDTNLKWINVFAFLQPVSKVAFQSKDYANQVRTIFDVCVFILKVRDTDYQMSLNPWW